MTLRNTELETPLPPAGGAAGPQQHLLAGMSTGLVIGILQVFLALSFAALIFSGELSFAISQGIGLVLMGTMLNAALIALFTTLPGTVGGSQGVPAAIMAVTVAAIAATLAGSVTQDELFLTAVAAIAATTLLTGIAFWGLGHFRLGGLVRFLPYPVVGGFLAGTGWLFVTGAIDVMVEMPNTVAALFQAPALWHWLPGAVLAAVILLVTRRSDHFLVLPGFLVGSLLLFFAVAALAGLSLAELSAGGWLLGPFESDASWRFTVPQAFVTASWPVIWGQAGNILAIVAVSAISLLLNAGGLELATDQDLEIDCELQIAGLANLAAGLAGGLVGYKQLSLSTLNFSLGTSGRLPGLIGVAVCALVLLAGGSAFALFPKIVIGSLLLFLGLNFLVRWVIEGFFKLPRIDYAIVLVILFVTISVGFLEAVGLGLLLAVILFVISYSQVDVVRHELDGASYKSRVSRSRQEYQALHEAADKQYILQLQGFVFFGTANNLLNQIRRRVLDPKQAPPEYVVLDFQRVTGLDSTGMLSFTRMVQLAENAGFTLLFTAPNARVREQLQQGSLQDDGRLIRIFPTLDQGIEWTENQILAAAGVVDEICELPLAGQLQHILPEAGDLAALVAHFERLDVQAGHQIITMGNDPEDLFFVEKGTVTAQIPRPGDTPLRLETAGSGSVIGEIGFYLRQQRTADVVTDEPSVLYRISLAGLQRLEEEAPELAADLHKLIIHLLAERVINLTENVRALER